MSSSKVDFGMLEELEKESEMLKECGQIRGSMSDWLELAHRVEIMAVQLQLKIILQLNDSALMESVDQLYYHWYSVISNKYGLIQAQYENFSEKLELLDPIGKHDSKLSAEVEEASKSFTKAWDTAKGELNSDLQDCLKRFEKLLDEVKQKLKDAGENGGA